jgi:hypothetical protein
MTPPEMSSDGFYSLSSLRIRVRGLCHDLPLCHSSLIKENQGRLVLWAAVIVELLAILVLNLAGKARG